MRLHLLLIPLVGLLAAADDLPKGLKTFQGGWTLSALVVEGKAIPEADLKNAKLTLMGEKYTFTDGAKTSGGIYKVDPTKKPAQLDIVIMKGADKGKTLLAIYERTGDKLKICLSFKGTRPTAFVSEPKSGTVLETWMKSTK
jgi:uncharacterized protein (TIGR03067 family)